MLYYIIDRFAGSLAVCEDRWGKRVLIKRSALPPGAKEGSVLRPDGAAYTLDPALEKKLRERNEALQRQVFGDA